MPRRLLVTGGSGHLGGEVCRRAPDRGWDVVGTYLRHAPEGLAAVALDVRDAAAVDALVERVRPDAVVHTAYVQTGDDTRATNVEGSANVARAARRAGARLVHVSSDMVFSGTRDRPLREEDPLEPVSPYGASKAEAERVVAEADPGAVIVRTSLIYGGPSGPASKHEATIVAAARGEVDWTCFDDELRSPVQVADLADALLELAERDDVAGPLHVAGPEAIDRYTFARRCARAAGEPADRLRSGPAPPGRPRDLTLDVSRARAVLRTRPRGVREVLG